MGKGILVGVSVAIASVGGIYFLYSRPKYIKVTAVAPDPDRPGLEIMYFNVEYFNQKWGPDAYFRNARGRTIDIEGWIANSYEKGMINGSQYTSAMKQIRQYM